ncbi:thylakoid associated Ser/Thr-protein kinase stt7 [Haematococcus lacustris]|uniref:Thylakoid associated Ser/Thr-protein kinase stt7 n=2 Tax=Haematococcus lacustris TaxID=44745 RepID=A0A699YFD7_HAELA|nr:thylakoid associated Ser/Thr-protein kinase stt7 [Haematococcus lacustris]
MQALSSKPEPGFSNGVSRHPGTKRSTGRLARPQALDSASIDAAAPLLSHLPLVLANVPQVALPCSMMQCGDVVHRSTLDLVLRGEQLGPDWRAFVLLGAVGAYLFAPPGVLPGAFDTYVLARQRGRVYTKDDIILGRKLATGGFGTVFRGEMKMEDGSTTSVIVKKAKEFGQAEAWMNERLMRLPGKHAAEFVAAFDESFVDEGAAAVQGAGRPRVAARSKGPLDNAVWLVWKYEGDNTLFDMMESKDFPYNLEPVLLDRELRLPKGTARKGVTIRLVMKQLLGALSAAHSTGIVHRDVKPQNCIVSEADKKVKLIDLGAAADLRVGINYVPNEYLLDPRYAPPQQYVMSTQTPRPPPAPVAAFLSPILWQMEHPDRFDMRLEGLRYDLNAWRVEEEQRRKGGMKPEMAWGFELLDEDGGAGWQLLCDLMAFKPADRITAAAALESPFLTGGAAAPLAASRSAINNAGRAVTNALNASNIMAGFSDAATGADRGSLTEAQLQQELGLEQPAPMASRRASTTISWWQDRQNEQRRSLQARRGQNGGTGGTSGTSGTSSPRAATPALLTPKPRAGSGSPVPRELPGVAAKAGSPANRVNGARAVAGRGAARLPSPRPSAAAAAAAARVFSTVGSSSDESEGEESDMEGGSMDGEDMGRGGRQLVAAGQREQGGLASWISGFNKKRAVQGQQEGLDGQCSAGAAGGSGRAVHFREKQEGLEGQCSAGAAGGFGRAVHFREKEGLEGQCRKGGGGSGRVVEHWSNRMGKEGRAAGVIRQLVTAACTGVRRGHDHCMVRLAGRKHTYPTHTLAGVPSRRPSCSRSWAWSSQHPWPRDAQAPLSAGGKTDRTSSADRSRPVADRTVAQGAPAAPVAPPHLAHPPLPSSLPSHEQAAAAPCLENSSGLLPRQGHPQIVSTEHAVAKVSALFAGLAGAVAGRGAARSPSPRPSAGAAAAAARVFSTVGSSSDESEGEESDMEGGSMDGEDMGRGGRQLVAAGQREQGGLASWISGFNKKR